MIYNNLLLALACSAGFLQIVIAQGDSVRGGRGGARNGTASAIAAQASGARGASSVAASVTAESTSSPVAGAGTSAGTGAGTGAGNAELALDPDNVQSASQSAGNGAEKAQAASATDDANFINFCSGKTLTNGLQVKGGSCNGIVMGDIPSTANMVSTIITNPAPGENIAANQDFDVNIQVSNLQLGSFTNPDSTYYAAPQALQGGQIVGHTHITIQTLGNDLTPNRPPGADKFAFFKGVNDEGDGNGGLSATVKGGLPAGNYRVCTMSSASNHQPVLMPVAQRGAQDDCTKFTVGGDGGANNNTGADNDNADATPTATSTSRTGGAAAGASNPASKTSATAAASSAAATSRTGSGTNTGGSRVGRRTRFASRAFLV